ncbi:MAG: GNAT family N-acetyltransferase [Pseudoxanthomonas sp.]
MFAIRRIETLDAGLQAQLVGLLRDVIDGNGSVGFGNDDDAALAGYWAEVAAQLGPGLRLWVAEQDGRVVGSVQLAPSQRSNGRHRGDLQKMMVLRAARGQGVAKALLRAAERHAAETGLTLLVLDTVVGLAADAMYRAAGWQEVGIIPDYATDPAGELQATRYYYKTPGFAPA